MLQLTYWKGTLRGEKSFQILRLVFGVILEITVSFFLILAGKEPRMPASTTCFLADVEHLWIRNQRICKDWSVFIQISIVTCSTVGELYHCNSFHFRKIMPGFQCVRKTNQALVLLFYVCYHSLRSALLCLRYAEPAFPHISGCTAVHW